MNPSKEIVTFPHKRHPKWAEEMMKRLDEADRYARENRKLTPEMRKIAEETKKAAEEQTKRVLENIKRDRRGVSQERATSFDRHKRMCIQDEHERAIKHIKHMRRGLDDLAKDMQKFAKEKLSSKSNSTTKTGRKPSER